MNKVELLKLYTYDSGTAKYGGLGDIISISADRFTANNNLLSGYNSLVQSIKEDEIIISKNYVDVDAGYAMIQTVEGTLYELVSESEPVDSIPAPDRPDIPDGFDYVAGV